MSKSVVRLETISTGVYVPGWTDYAVTVLRQFAELLYDESSKRTEVTRQCYAGLASGESCSTKVLAAEPGFYTASPKQSLIRWLVAAYRAIL